MSRRTRHVNGEKKRLKWHTVEACEECGYYVHSDCWCMKADHEVKNEREIPQWCPLEDVKEETPEKKRTAYINSTNWGQER